MEKEKRQSETKRGKRKSQSMPHSIRAQSGPTESSCSRGRYLRWFIPRFLQPRFPTTSTRSATTITTMTATATTQTTPPRTTPPSTRLPRTTPPATTVRTSTAASDDFSGSESVSPIWQPREICTPETPFTMSPWWPSVEISEWVPAPPTSCQGSRPSPAGRASSPLSPPTSLHIVVLAGERPLYEPILVSDFVFRSFDDVDHFTPLSVQSCLKLKEILKGVKVEVTYGTNSEYIVTGVTTQPMNQLMVTPEYKNAELTLLDFYRERYYINLKYRTLPALEVSSGECTPSYLPMELCMIVPRQRYSRKLDASVLPPPVLRYGPGGEARAFPEFGQWNMKRKRMLDGGTVTTWAFVNFSSSQGFFSYFFCSSLVETCRNLGVRFCGQPLLPFQSATPDQVEETLWDIHRKCKERLQLLIVILPDSPGSCYGTIKRICETKLGIVSQCCQPKKAANMDEKFRTAYFSSLALKINVKVGGRNTALYDAIERRIPLVTDIPTIIMGADVSHSAAAVVASMDWPQVSKYRAHVCADGSHQGLADEGMIRDQLIAFQKSNGGRKPKRIIYYRYVARVGDLSQVQLYEVLAIRKACASLEDDYQPPITFVIVHRRRDTRFCLFGDSGEDASWNVLPGTVVDSRICQPTQCCQFYLHSHAAVQGASRPTYYRVLLDENGFQAITLETLTNNLCYTSARCTRSVAIVPPAHYARLAASRARHYVVGGSSECSPQIMKDIQKVMYYC